MIIRGRSMFKIEWKTFAHDGDPGTWCDDPNIFPDGITKLGNRFPTEQSAYDACNVLIHVREFNPSHLRVVPAD